MRGRSAWCGVVAVFHACGMHVEEDLMHAGEVCIGAE